MNFLVQLLVISIILGGCASDGKNGRDGIDGIDGSMGPVGIQGESGDVGETGPRGDDGYTTLVSLVDTGDCVTILSGLDTNRNLVLEGEEVSSNADICDGEMGSPGVVEIIDPCGDAPGIYDEVLLRLATNEILASFSDNLSGKNTRFAVLTEGTYQTTDGSNCVFAVNENGEIE